MARRFLVTGGAGFVGSHMVAALRDRGEDVVVLDTLRTGHRAAVPSDVRLIEADLGDTARLDSVLADGPWSAVFHFAAMTQVGESMRMPMRYLLENAANGMKLIDATWQCHINHAAFYNRNIVRIQFDGILDDGWNHCIFTRNSFLDLRY